MSSYISERCPQCGAELPMAGEQAICGYCGSRLIRSRSTSGKPSDGGQPTLVQGLSLKTFAYVDTQGIGTEAFRMLIPSSWEFRGGIQWVLNNPGMPAVISFRVYNPSGLEVFEVFPALTFFWTNQPMLLMTFPRGSRYLGNEVQPPCGALQAIREMVIPRYRQQVGSIETLKEEALPDLPKQLKVLNPNASGGASSAEGAKVRIRYTRGDQSIDEEIFGVVQVQRNLMPTFMGSVENILWSADYLFSFQSPAEHLDDFADLFQTILYSFRINPDWFNRYIQISNGMIQNQIGHINQIGQLSRSISQSNNQISDMIMSSYYQRQETMDHISANFSQTIRGVDEYYSPFEDHGVELPGGYDHAWANALGEYIVTDDPNFNPNINSNQKWEPMRRS